MIANVSIKLDAVSRQKIGSLATVRKRAPHYLPHEAITQYIEREGFRLSLLDDAITSHSDFEATGLHITLDEFDHWTDKLASNPTAKIPTCHV